ncbi:class I SAM-dependent methyltransferase [Nanoarchaeota archaeon]
MYNEIAGGYDELHKEEQLKKLAIVKDNLKIKKTDKLLDVGCGTGISADFECDVTGIDPSEKLIKYAERKFPHGQFMLADAEEMPFEDNEFDVVVSLTAIHNFDDIEKGLSEIKRVGKKKFALTILKKSEKFNEIKNKIKESFDVKKEVDEEKDVIFII